jgi:hypothetical protein
VSVRTSATYLSADSFVGLSGKFSSDVFGN